MTPLGARSAQSTTTPATLILIGAGLAALLWAISAGSTGAWPLIIASLAFFVAIRLNRNILTYTPLDLPLAIFLGTAVVGIWTAYDTDAAQAITWR